MLSPAAIVEIKELLPILTNFQAKKVNLAAEGSDKNRHRINYREADLRH
jgi:hypothetical protein